MSQIMSVVAILIALFAGASFAALIFFVARWRREQRSRLREQIVREVRTEMISNFDTSAELPMIMPWQRTGGLYDDPSPTLEHRIIRQASLRDTSSHYPFALPNLCPMTPLPDVMKEPAHIHKVVMRANDWLESRDQYGFVMPQYSGLWQHVGQAVRNNFDGEWLVPKKKTGYHKITRFKRVRPQDHPFPLIHPRDLPEVINPPREMSPLA